MKPQDLPSPSSGQTLPSLNLPFYSPRSVPSTRIHDTAKPRISSALGLWEGTHGIRMGAELREEGGSARSRAQPPQTTTGVPTFQLQLRTGSGPLKRSVAVGFRCGRGWERSAPHSKGRKRRGTPSSPALAERSFCTRDRIYIPWVPSAVDSLCGPIGNTAGATHKLFLPFHLN